MIKKLFLSHYSGDKHEVEHLAKVLRMYGIVPWLDKDGGFMVADESEQAARKAISGDCFGLLLYATKHVFDRRFISEVEVPAAVKVKKTDNDYLLFALPRGIDFATLSERSREAFGIDLSAFHTIPIADDEPLGLSFCKVSIEIVKKLLSKARHENHDDSLSFQLSTRETMPDKPEDVLCIDATRIFSADIGLPEEWKNLQEALCQIKQEVSSIFGRPRIHVHGSKHLTAAFVFGRVFSRFPIDIQQTPNEIWRSDINVSPHDHFASHFVQCNRHESALLVEAAVGNKNVPKDVDAFLKGANIQPKARLQLSPRGSPIHVDNHICRQIADQTYREIEKALSSSRFTEIHLFVAGHQAYMMMLGQKFSGTPPAHLYEWTGQQYVRSCSVT